MQLLVQIITVSWEKDFYLCFSLFESDISY